MNMQTRKMARETIVICIAHVYKDDKYICICNCSGQTSRGGTAGDNIKPDLKESICDVNWNQVAQRRVQWLAV